MRLTKAELATRLIEAEQYIAEGNQEYLRHMKDKSGIKIISCRDKRSGFPLLFHFIINVKQHVFTVNSSLKLYFFLSFNKTHRLGVFIL